MFKKCICNTININSLSINDNDNINNNVPINDNVEDIIKPEDNKKNKKNKMTIYNLYYSEILNGKITLMKYGLSNLYFINDNKEEIVINFKRSNIHNYRNYIIIKLNNKYYNKWYIKILKRKFLISKNYITHESNIKNIIVIKRNIDKYNVRHYINYTK